MDFKIRVHLDQNELRTLAKIGALNGLAQDRRAALWEVEEHADASDLFFHEDGGASNAPLAPMNSRERLHADYGGTGLTVGPHPMQLARTNYPDLWPASALANARQGDHVRIGGAVICRQRPGTAKGFVFVSLEDETGIANAIITPILFEKCRLLISQASFLIIGGLVQNHERVMHVKAHSVELLPIESFDTPKSHDFH